MKMHRIIGNNEVAAAVNSEETTAFEKRKIYRDSLARHDPVPVLSSIVSVTPQWTSDPLLSVPPIWDLPSLQIPSIWSHYGTRGEGVNVYVLDSGYSAHPAFSVRSGRCFLPGIEETTDGLGHGTWVAGKIGGSGIGIAPKCNIHIGRVLDESGTGSVNFTIKALEWVLRERDPHIVNLSSGSTTPSLELEKLILKLQHRGVVVVTSAGNYSYDACLTVGAVGRAGQKAEFKTFGGTLDIATHGISSYSSYLHKSFRALDDKSIVTPIVSGILALAYSFLRAQGRSTIEIRKVVLDAMLSTARKIEPRVREDQYGFGGIDVKKFMAAVHASN